MCSTVLFSEPLVSCVLMFGSIPLSERPAGSAGCRAASSAPRLLLRGRLRPKKPLSASDSVRPPSACEHIL
eukprot:274477-Pleurochrysis_carterae.AAC.5